MKEILTSCPPFLHRLQGGPSSAPTHLIFNFLHTVQALLPLVLFFFGSSVGTPSGPTDPPAIEPFVFEGPASGSTEVEE